MKFNPPKAQILYVEYLNSATMFFTQVNEKYLIGQALHPLCL
jgi:hypothetical protein